MTRRTGLALFGVAVLAVLAVLVLAGVAARSGSYAPELPATPTPSAVTGAPPPPAEEAGAAISAPTTTAAPQPVNPVTGRVVLVLVLLLAAAGLVLLAQLAVRHRPRPRRRRPPDAEIVHTAGPGTGAALQEAVAEALLAVDQPDAREAVVQAWLRLGAAAAAAGTPSRPAETAAEYAERVAGAHGLPSASVHRLAALYREARFSGHPVRDDHRDAARAELTALQAALSAAPTGGRR